MGKQPVRGMLVCVTLVAAACMAIIALILIVVKHYSVDLPPSFQYGMVFDAGSSHTAMYLYQWPGGKENNTGVVSQVLLCDVDGPGISSYASNPTGAGKSLKKCLDDAMQAMPAENWGSTPVYLGATAGMRLLNLTNVTQTNQVMNEISKTMQDYPFDFRGARILSGTEEGAYGWITINYLLEGFIKYSFQGKWAHPTTGDILGALDLGGASTQITFTPNGPVQDPQTAASFRLYGFNYNVYTHSYLCYGKDQAMKMVQAQLHKVNLSSVISHPCYHTGFKLLLAQRDLYDSPCLTKPSQFDAAANITFYGTGDPDKCLDLVRTIFTFNDCPFLPHCAINGIYQPPVNGKFFAFSAYYYTFSFLGLAPQAPLPTVISTIDSFCRKNWTMLKAENPTVKDKYLLDYCGSAVYIKTLLLEGFKFYQSWNNIYFQQKAANADIGWTLGYMLNLTNQISRDARPMVTGIDNAQWIACIFFIVFAIFLSLLVLFFLYK